MRCRKSCFGWSRLSLLAALALPGLALGCNPARPGERAAMAASTTSAEDRPAAPDPTEGGCMLSLAQRNARYITTVFRTVDAWARECHPRMAELEQLTWADIPESSQPLVEAHWHEQFRQAKAQRALELGVPASSMGCAPQHPDCDVMSDDDAALSYAAIVRVAILQVLDATQAAAQDSTALRDEPLDEERAGAIVGSQERHLDELRAAVLELQALLPTSGALPGLELPVSADPAPCR
jgi:hypothetical protein